MIILPLWGNGRGGSGFLLTNATVYFFSSQTDQQAEYDKRWYDPGRAADIHGYVVHRQVLDQKIERGKGVEQGAAEHDVEEDPVGFTAAQKKNNDGYPGENRSVLVFPHGIVTEEITED